MTADTIESIIEYLKEQGIQANYDKTNAGKLGLNRVIEFEVEGTKYWIEWWLNQSYLKLKNGFSKPCVPFKYINVNHNSPTSEHKLHLCFYDEKEPKKGQFLYNEIPFGSLRIPFNP